MTFWKVFIGNYEESIFYCEIEALKVEELFFI